MPNLIPQSEPQSEPQSNQFHQIEAEQGTEQSNPSKDENQQTTYYMIDSQSLETVMKTLMESMFEKYMPPINSTLTSIAGRLVSLENTFKAALICKDSEITFSNTEILSADQIAVKELKPIQTKDEMENLNE